MHVGTDEEVHNLLSDKKWDCGIKVDGTNLYYDGLFAELEDLNPIESPGMRRRFCPVS